MHVSPVVIDYTYVHIAFPSTVAFNQSPIIKKEGKTVNEIFCIIFLDIIFFLLVIFDCYCIIIIIYKRTFTVRKKVNLGNNGFDTLLWRR